MFSCTFPRAYQNSYISDVKNRLIKTNAQADLLLKKDTQHLPKLIQKYIQYTGSINQPKIHLMHAELSGRMKQKIDSSWLSIQANQYNFFSTPARFFYISSSIGGIPFDGYHSYSEKGAFMNIRIASLFQIVDAKGEHMNKSETVTFLNDVCLMAPAFLIDPSIQWREINSTQVEAIYKNLHHTVSAVLTFDTSGALVNFVSKDRYLSPDGKTYTQYPWSTPIHSYTNYGSRRLVKEASAVWHMNDTLYTYAEFTIEQISYTADSTVW
jgi:hypothetical protein